MVYLWGLTVPVRGTCCSDDRCCVATVNLRGVHCTCTAVLSRSISCYLIGHDWGGAVTWKFCEKYPSLVEKAVMLQGEECSTVSREAYSP